MHFPVLPFPYYASDHQYFIFISFTSNAWSSTSWELIESVDSHFLNSANCDYHIFMQNIFILFYMHRIRNSEPGQKFGTNIPFSFLF